MTPFDPEFDRPIFKHKAGSRPQLKTRDLRLVLVLALTWVGIAWFFGLLALTLAFISLILGGMAILVLAMIPSLFGYGLFALLDVFVATCRRAGRWPDEAEKMK